MTARDLLLNADAPLLVAAQELIQRFLPSFRRRGQQPFGLLGERVGAIWRLRRVVLAAQEQLAGLSRVNPGADGRRLDDPQLSELRKHIVARLSVNASRHSE